jgi:hypothetical protein
MIDFDKNVSAKSFPNQRICNVPVIDRKTSGEGGELSVGWGHPRFWEKINNIKGECF